MSHAMPSARVFAVLSFVMLACIGAAPEDRIHQSFATTANPEVRLENITGRILVRPWDNNSVDITAIKRAPDADTFANLTVEISKEGDPVTWIRARERYQHNDAKGGSVDYTVSAPRHAKLRISSVSGNIIADGFANDLTANTVSGDISVRDTDGNLKIDTVTGTIEASMTHVNGRSASLHTVTGMVQLVIPRNSGAAVKVSSLAGKFQSDFPLDETSQVVGTTAKGRIGDGSGSIELGTVSGELALKSR